MKYLTLSYPFFLLSITACSLHGRSPFRPQETWLPTITLKWTHEDKTYSVKNDHLEEYPYFKIFDKDYFYSHLISDAMINYRYEPEKTVVGTQLAQLVEHLLSEIYERKKSYTHFTVLQKKDFSRRKACGLVVLKFKDYPFVVKLFIETPQTFIKPSGRGIEPVFFYYMGGGVNRHLSGLTRLKNLDYINSRLAQSPEFSKTVSTPRKWFWLPQEPLWFSVKGENMGGVGTVLTSQIPSTYAIIADAIEAEHQFSIKEPEDREFALKLCNYMDLNVDPHITNFMVEKNTGKVVIVDTEHFLTMVGFKKKYSINSYFSWYMQMTEKCAKDMLFCTKSERKARQSEKFPFALRSRG